MLDRPDLGLTAPAVPSDPCVVGVDGYATAEDVAFSMRLAELDRAERESGGWYDADLDEPPAWESRSPGDDDVVAALAGGVQAADLMLLDSIDPRGLSENLNRVDYLRALDRVGAFVAAKRCEVIVAMVGERSSEAYLPEVHLEHELSVAARTSRYAAGRAIEVARSLATEFPGFGAALRAGEISEGHCRVLVERTRVVADPEALAEIEARVLPKAKRLAVGKFGAEVATVIARLDRDAAARVTRARATRRVWSRQLEDGMGYLGVTHDWSTIAAMKSEIDTAGRCLQVQRGGSGAVADGVADATADACRADAMAALVLGEHAEDGSTTWDREQVAVTVNVVMDLPTLRGEADQVAVVDGQPVPGEIGREIAQFATWWRRLVTDPVDGHLLDYGTRTYLPEALRRFVLARDRGCRNPRCTTQAESRLQMDHADEFPHGDSSAANCGALCTTCHQLKTAGYADISDSNTDGSCDWTTAWGQRIHIPRGPSSPSNPTHPRPNPHRRHPKPHPPSDREATPRALIRPSTSPREVPLGGGPFLDLRRNCEHRGALCEQCGGSGQCEREQAHRR